MNMKQNKKKHLWTGIGLILERSKTDLCRNPLFCAAGNKNIRNYEIEVTQ